MKRNKIFVIVLALTMSLAGAEVFAQNQIPNTSAGQTPENRVNDKRSAMSRDYSDTNEEETIVEVAAAKPEFSDLVDAASEAGLVETLREEGPYTLFAPTNRAFEKLSSTQREELMKEENKEQLKSVINYHIVEGQYTADDLRDGQKLTTIDGNELIVKKKGNNLMVNGAKVAITDVKASNGVIHIIDTVVMPEKGSKSKSTKKAQSGSNK
jgi:uncharacterized surface protein with fasciclin (FAS1) repeats